MPNYDGTGPDGKGPKRQNKGFPERKKDGSGQGRGRKQNTNSKNKGRGRKRGNRNN